MAKVTISDDNEKSLKQVQKRRGLETLSEAADYVIERGCRRLNTLKKYNEKKADAPKAKAKKSDKPAKAKKKAKKDPSEKKVKTKKVKDEPVKPAKKKKSDKPAKAKKKKQQELPLEGASDLSTGEVEFEDSESEG